MFAGVAKGWMTQVMSQANGFRQILVAPQPAGQRAA